MLRVSGTSVFHQDSDRLVLTVNPLMLRAAGMDRRSVDILVNELAEVTSRHLEENGGAPAGDSGRRG